MKKVWLITVCCLTLSSLAFSQAKQGRTKLTIIHGAPTTCPNDPVLPSDGIVTGEDLLFRGTTAFYSLNAKGGHSYSIEVWDPFDSTTNVSPDIQVGTACNSNDIQPMNVTEVDPDLSGGFSHRVSWVQGSDQTLQIAVSNADPNNDYAYYIRVTDTSLHNIHWSTFAPFDTQWSLANLTSVETKGTLTVVNEQGTTVATIPITIPAGRFVQISAIGRGVPANQQGAATFVYVGPSGAIRGDTTIIKSDASVITLSSFVSQHSTY